MNMKKILVLLGAPGSGKGQQSALLSNNGYVVVSSGQLLRQYSQDDSVLGRSINACLADGKLVPDSIMIDMVRDHITGLDAEYILLDGFPRTLAQAQAMTALGIIPTHVMVYVIPDAVVLDRITGRWFEPKSGRVYHEKYHPPQHSGKDDITGDVLVRRSDDTPEVMQERLAIYHSAVKDILAYYHVLQQKNLLTVCYLNADDSIDGVHHALMSALH